MCSDEESHQKVVSIPAEYIFDILARKLKIVKSDIPEDAKYVRSFMDHHSFPEAFCIVMEHEDFPTTPYGFPILHSKILTNEQKANANTEM